MSPRRWQNVAKYFYDISKVIIAVAVISPLFDKHGFNWEDMVLGATAGFLLFCAALLLDWKGDEHA